MKQLEFLSPDEMIFERSANGFLNLKLKNQENYEKVECIPLFPFSKPDSYVSVSIRKDKELVEIAVIKELKILSSEQRNLVQEDIDFRYFTPEILEIKQIMVKHGIYQWDVVTDKGEKTFFVRDIKENISFRENGLMIISDFDKCRYQIRDYQKLSAKSQKELNQTLL